MSLGNKLYDLRKKVQLSQEEVAEKLEVTRQTVSKWETDQSTPDFDKIVPICELYGITPNELLFDVEEQDDSSLKKIEKENSYLEDEIYKRGKRAQGISLGVLLYFVGIVWIMISVPVLMANPILASAVLMLIWGFATYCIVYVCIMYKKKEKTVIEENNKNVQKTIRKILAIITCILYLVISFATMAWYITWIMWIVYGLVVEILKLIFLLKENAYEK